MGIIIFSVFLEKANGPKYPTDYESFLWLKVIIFGSVIYSFCSIAKYINKRIKHVFQSKLGLRDGEDIFGLEPFYAELDTFIIYRHKYQSYFSKWLNSGMSEKLIQDLKKEGLDEVVFTVLCLQYQAADTWERERHKDDWVNTVLYRKNIDFFPSPEPVLLTMDESSKYL